MEPIPLDPQWPELAPLAEEIEPPPFPTDRLPGWLGRFVRAQATATQVPEDLPGMIGLACLSAAVQGKINVVANNATWTEPVCLYTAVAMPPGERKSSVFQHMTRPLMMWELEVQDLERPLVAASMQERKELEALVESTQRDVNKAHTALLKLRRDQTATTDSVRAAEADLMALRDQAVEVQMRLDTHQTRRPMRILYDDVTPEAAVTQLVEQHERIALMSAEGGIFDILAGRYSEKPALDIFLKGHAGDFVRVDRKSSEPAALHRPLITLGLAIQPAVLSAIGKSRDMHGRGLLARFCYSMPRTLFGSRLIDPDPVPDQVRAAYEDGMQEIARSAYAREEIATLFLDDEADGVFMGFQSGLEPRLKPEEGDLDSIAEWASKLAGAVLRIAALLAAARCRGIPDEIVYDDVIGAIEIGEYLIAHAWLAHQVMGLAPQVSLESKIVRRIRREHWTQFKTRDLQRSLRSARDITADDLDEVLDDLQRLGYIKKRTTSLKPLRYHWDVNPAVYASEAVA